MDTRKITLIATIAVIALVAVGVGYAYTASTTNTGNSATVTHVVLTQQNYTFGNENVEWNTATSKDLSTSTVTTTYTLNGVTDTTAVSGSKNMYLYKIGNSDTLTATGTNAGTNPFPVTIDSTSITGMTTGIALVVKVTLNSTYYYAYTEDGTNWTYSYYNGTSWAGAAPTAFSLTGGTAYKTELYMGLSSNVYTVTKVGNNEPSGSAPTGFISGNIVFGYDSNPA